MPTKKVFSASSGQTIRKVMDGGWEKDKTKSCKGR